MPLKWYLVLSRIDIYRVTAVLKVETDIMWSIAASLIGRVDTNSGNICGDLENWRYCFYHYCYDVFDIALTNIFQYQSQFVDAENIYEIKAQMSKWLNKVCIKLVIQNSSKTNLIYRMVGFFHVTRIREHFWHTCRKRISTQ